MFCLTYEFRLKPNKQQISVFEDWLEINRKVYNYALAERKHWYKSRSSRINSCSLHSEYIIPADVPRPTFALQCKSLTAAKDKYPDLKRVAAQVLQQTLKRLESAFTSMWERDFGLPRFKKTGQIRSFVFSQPGRKPLKKGAVKLPVIGWVKFRSSRDIPEDAVVKQTRVVKRASGWYVMITLEWNVSRAQPTPHAEALGVDVGLMSFIATSNGLCVKRPKFFIDLQRQLKLLQQRVSRKKLGSNNWRKALHKVAKLHENIANARKDFHWKVAHQLCDQAKTIFVEDLNLVGLSRGMLGKHCLDAGWGQFFSILEQCCFKRGIYFQKLDSKKTSQICPNCGTETGKKDLSERVHVCENCSYATDRDVAAAQIVLNRGCAAVGQTVKMLNEGKVVGLPLS